MLNAWPSAKRSVALAKRADRAARTSLQRNLRKSQAFAGVLPRDMNLSINQGICFEIQLCGRYGGDGEIVLDREPPTILQQATARSRAASEREQLFILFVAETVRLCLLAPPALRFYMS